MGYVPPLPPPDPALISTEYGRPRDLFRPNLDRFGMPRDFATYMWATYGPGRDLDPERRRFLYPPREDPVFEHHAFGQQICMR